MSQTNGILESEIGGKVLAVYNWVEKETEKAVLLSANGETWLPKSQVQLYKVDGAANVIALPGWLWKNHRMVFSWKVDREKFIEAVKDGRVIRN